MKAPSIDIKVREVDGHREVFDPVRRRWVALTPEEWVRQYLILSLHNDYGYPYELMQVEGAISVNGMTRRCDIVIYNDGHPWMIVECKQPNVALTQKVCDQACRYNTVLHVPYLLLSNGRQTIAIEVDYLNNVARPMMAIPPYHKKS